MDNKQRNSAGTVITSSYGSSRSQKNATTASSVSLWLTRKCLMDTTLGIARSWTPRHAKCVMRFIKGNDVGRMCIRTRYSTTTTTSPTGTGRIVPGHAQRPSPQQRMHQSRDPNTARSMRDPPQTPVIWNITARSPPTKRDMRHSYGPPALLSRTKRDMADPTCRKRGLHTTSAARRTATTTVRGTNLQMPVVTSNGGHLPKTGVHWLPRSGVKAVNSGRPRQPQSVHQTQSRDC
jgi:hypothetical protein